jgi:hypothetical protein
VKDICTLRLSPSTGFQDGSQGDSQIGQRPHIFKVVSEYITADSKVPMGAHVTLNYLGLIRFTLNYIDSYQFTLNYVEFCSITLTYDFNGF